jgi:succinoglycan biosynthesis transport protein ExoP
MQNRSDMQALNDKKAFLQSQLAAISPYQSVGADGRAATPQAQLMSLELQYVDLSSKYGPKHPDVVRLQKQIAALKGQLGTNGGTTSSQAQLSQLQSQLETAQQRYGEKHPQVQKLRAQIAELSAEAKKDAAQTVLSAPQGAPDNPLYIQFQSQLADVQSQLGGLQAQTASLQSRLDDLQQKVLQTPAIESEYNSLLEQYNSAVTRYQSLKDKEADAKVAESMEQQNKGETFSVIEPPDLPVIPIKPNRKLLLAAGVFLSFMLAFGLMLAIEMLDSRIYNGNLLESAFGETPLVHLPYITNQSEVRNRRLRIAASVAAVLVVAGGGLLYVNDNMMPLDVAYAAFINRVNP